MPTITPANIAAIDRAARGSIVLNPLTDFSWEHLNEIRWCLAQRDQRESIQLGGDNCTIDAAIDTVVARLLGGKPGLRLRQPRRASDALWSRVRGIFAEHEDEVLFFIDDEREPFDAGLMFDVYEEYLFADEM